MVGYYYPPEQPETEFDKYYGEFEVWVNDNYDMQDNSIFGYHIPWDEACESDDVFDMFMIQMERAKDV
jgi:hypothetical protein